MSSCSGAAGSSANVSHRQGPNSVITTLAILAACFSNATFDCNRGSFGCSPSGHAHRDRERPKAGFRAGLWSLLVGIVLVVLFLMPSMVPIEAVTLRVQSYSMIHQFAIFWPIK